MFENFLSLYQYFTLDNPLIPEEFIQAFLGPYPWLFYVSLTLPFIGLSLFIKKENRNKTNWLILSILIITCSIWIEKVSESIRFYTSGLSAQAYVTNDNKVFFTFLWIPFKAFLGFVYASILFFGFEFKHRKQIAPDTLDSNE